MSEIKLVIRLVEFILLQDFNYLINKLSYVFENVVKLKLVVNSSAVYTFFNVLFVFFLSLIRNNRFRRGFISAKDTHLIIQYLEKLFLGLCIESAFLHFLNVFPNITQRIAQFLGKTGWDSGYVIIAISFHDCCIKNNVTKFHFFYLLLLFYVLSFCYACGFFCCVYFSRAYYLRFVITSDRFYTPNAV